MPPSVRFLGRRRYIAAVFALVSPRGQSSSWLAQAVDVPVRTLDRWRRWWRETFVSSRQWRALQGRLLPPIEPDALPRELLDRLRSRRSTYRLVRLLKLLCPLSTSSVQWEPAM
ncbi:MAG TPA: hypothetical protein VEB21_04455 [Terriglobales bacterium]|nr:hypothetical protein [Terriglobales bacterium]